MEMPAGRKLTIVALALAAVAAAAAVRLAVSGDLRSAGVGGIALAGDPVSAGRSLALARAADASGDLASALSHYRAAVEANPRLVDRRSPEFLGASFEEKVKLWVSGLKGGGIRAAPTALPDASFLFRRMYGGCG